MLSESYQWRANKQKNEYQGRIQTEKFQHLISSLLKFKILLANYKTLQNGILWNVENLQICFPFGHHSLKSKKNISTGNYKEASILFQQSGLQVHPSSET